MLATISQRVRSKLAMLNSQGIQKLVRYSGDSIYPNVILKPEGK